MKNIEDLLNEHPFFAAMDDDLLLALFEDPEVDAHLAVSIMFYEHIIERADPLFHIFMAIRHKPVPC